MVFLSSLLLHLPAKDMQNIKSVYTVKPVLSGHSKEHKIGFQYQLSLNAGPKSIAEWEHSAILLTSIKLSFSITTMVLSIFKWPLKTGLTVPHNMCNGLTDTISSRLNQTVLRLR